MDSVQLISHNYEQQKQPYVLVSKIIHSHFVSDFIFDSSIFCSEIKYEHSYQYRYKMYG